MWKKKQKLLNFYEPQPSKNAEMVKLKFLKVILIKRNSKLDPRWGGGTFTYKLVCYNGFNCDPLLLSIHFLMPCQCGLEYTGCIPGRDIRPFTPTGKKKEVS